MLDCPTWPSSRGSIASDIAAELSVEPIHPRGLVAQAEVCLLESKVLVHLVDFKNLTRGFKKVVILNDENGRFASSFSPLRRMTSREKIASKIAKFVSLKSRFESPFRLDQVSFSTPDCCKPQ